MKKILLIAFGILFLASIAYADKLTLNSPETLAVPTAQTLVWDKVEIINHSKTLIVYYHWEDAAGKRVFLNGRYTIQKWYCNDMPAFDPLTCIDIDNPDDCCTGPGAGTGCYAGDTCFTDTFGFDIRTQDVGTKLGLGLRQLIWSKMRDDVLSGGNDGTFQ